LNSDEIQLLIDYFYYKCHRPLKKRLKRAVGRSEEEFSPRLEHSGAHATGHEGYLRSFELRY
jgi:hypothetical protein